MGKAGLLFLRRCVEQNRTPDAGDLKLILRDYERLQLKAKHVAQSVNTIRCVMRLNREHKDLFGGAVYLVDHTHMWALVRNAEDLEALLADTQEKIS